MPDDNSQNASPANSFPLPPAPPSFDNTDDNFYQPIKNTTPPPPPPQDFNNSSVFSQTPTDPEEFSPPETFSPPPITPTPSSNPDYEQEQFETATEGPIITDPVAPEMTNQKVSLPPIPPSPTEPEPVLATLPKKSNSLSTILTILLMIFAIGAIAIAVAFYIRYQKTQVDLNEATSTKERQEIITPSVTSSASSSAEYQFQEQQIITINPSTTPTPTPANPEATFSRLTEVFALATKDYPEAKLLLITATNLTDSNSATYKYWFRKSATEKIYFYILAEKDHDLSLIDQQVYVTPDNDIPSLNEDFAAGNLGIDLDETTLLVKNQVITYNKFTSPTSLTAKFIKTNVNKTLTNLWELTYKFTSSTPVVVQVNSQTKKIIFSNVKYTNLTSTTATTSATTIN